MRKEQFSHVNLYLIFSYFLYKKISGDSTPFTQKERCLVKAPKSLFLRGTKFVVTHNSQYQLQQPYNTMQATRLLQHNNPPNTIIIITNIECLQVLKVQIFIK